MKLLVTGGAGYIGSIVGRQLLGEGHDVVVLDNLERGHREAVPARRVWSSPTCSTRDGRGCCARARASTACCISPRSRWSASRSATRSATTARTSAGRSTCSRRWPTSGVTRLVFSSTCAVYGQPDEVPIAETAPPRPTNAYGASKLAVDRMIGDFCLRPRPRRGQPAVLQRRRRQRRARRGPRSRDAPDPEHPPGRARDRRRRWRSSAPTTRRRTARRSATTSTSRIWPPRTCSRSTARARASTGSSISATATASRCAR